MSKAEQAYQHAFLKLAATYVDLAQIVGYVNASDFFRRFGQEWTIPDAKNRGGRPRKQIDPETRNEYNLAKGRKKTVSGDDTRRIQRRNQEAQDNEATRKRLTE